MAPPIFYTLSAHERQHFFCTIDSIGYEDGSLLLHVSDAKLHGSDATDFTGKWTRYAAGNPRALYSDVLRGISTQLAEMTHRGEVAVTANVAGDQLRVHLLKPQAADAAQVLSKFGSRAMAYDNALYPSFLPQSAIRNFLAMLPPDIDHGGGKGPVAEQKQPRAMTMAAGAGAGAGGSSPLKWAMRNDSPPSPSRS